MILRKWLDPAELPAEVAFTAITLAELSAGPHEVRRNEEQSDYDEHAERGRRLDILQRAENEFDPIPFDIDAACIYGRVCAAVIGAGRKPRRRVADLMIAAIAIAIAESSRSSPPTPTTTRDSTASSPSSPPPGPLSCTTCSSHHIRTTRGGTARSAAGANGQGPAGASGLVRLAGQHGCRQGTSDSQAQSPSSIPLIRRHPGWAVLHRHPRRAPDRGADPSEYAGGLLDTKIVILRKRIAPGELPAGVAISATTLAELFAGPHEVRRNEDQDDYDEHAERGRRLDIQQRTGGTARAPEDTGRCRPHAAAASQFRGPRDRIPIPHRTPGRSGFRVSPALVMAEG